MGNQFMNKFTDNLKSVKKNSLIKAADKQRKSVFQLLEKLSASIPASNSQFHSFHSQFPTNLCSNVIIDVTLIFGYSAFGRAFDGFI